MLRLISQPAAPWVKSRTLWSAVYDLTDGSLDLAVGGQYHAVRHYSL